MNYQQSLNEINSIISNLKVKKKSKAPFEMQYSVPSQKDIHDIILNKMNTPGQAQNSFLRSQPYHIQKYHPIIPTFNKSRGELSS